MQTINDNFHLNAGKSLDDRKGKVIAGKTVPFISVTEANSFILSSFRYIGLTVFVNDGSGLREFWYKNGTSDSDIVEKIATANTVFGLPYFTSGYDINLDGTISSFTFLPTLDFTPANVIVVTTNIDAAGFEYSLNNSIVTVQYSTGPNTGVTHFGFTFFKPNP